LPVYTSDKGFIIRIYSELKKLACQRINNPLNKCANELNRKHSKEEGQIVNKNMKKCSTWP
jgi:hypothetical protein